MSKVVRYALKSAESKLDPQSESDEASGSINEQIFDSLLQYDYLARPAKLQPRTAAALPQVDPTGTVYVLKVKPGIYFTPDPAFKGARRELVAADYVYSLKRLLDPKLKSQWLFLVEGKIKGADAVMNEARATNRFDYDKPIEGLKALDRYTLRIELGNTDFGFANVLALQATSALAREVVEYYGDDIAAHPVGTGPYMLRSWTRGSKLMLEANPGYREEFFDGDPGEDARSHEIHARLKGRRIPIVGRIEISVIDEDQPRWLAFLNGEHEYIRPVPEEFATAAIPGGELAPNLRRKGITATPDEIAYTTYTTFNMQAELDGRRNDIGGYTPERIALRRAIAMAYRIDDQIALLDKRQSRRAYSPLPPGVAGYDPKFVSPTLEYNPAKAKALLDMFGFVDRDGDGYRENPDGSPLAFDHAWYPRQRERDRNQLWKSSMDDIGVRVTFDKVEKLPELRKQARVGKVQSFSYGWIADYPDGENFLQLFTTKSIGGANYTLFSRPEYDAMYEQSRSMPDSPERTEIYRRMVHMLWVYAPWRVNSLLSNTILIHPWVIGYKKHPFQHEPWRYLDVDLERAPRR